MKRLLVASCAVFVFGLLSCLLAAAPERQFKFISPRGEWNTTTNGGPQVAAFSGMVKNAREVAKAEAFVTSLGTFELYVNGALVSSTEDGNRCDYLRPGVTDPKLRRPYKVYDITGLIRKEKGTENCLSAFVSASWFSDTVGGLHKVKPALAAEIKLEYADGTAQTFRTDGSWCASFDTPFIRAGIYEGEKFDARMRRSAAECAGKAHAEINTNFTGVTSMEEGPDVSLRCDIAAVPYEAYKYDGAEGAGKDVFGHVKKTGVFRPGEPIQLAAGETLVLDFAQNAAAIPEIVASAAKGVTMTFRGAEMLNDANGERVRGNDGPAGSIYRANYRTIKDNGALVEYVFAGSGKERYLPTFTFMGYRYADIRATGPLTIWSIRSIPVTSIRKSMELGTVTTGDKFVNRLISNVKWGQYSNYVSIPTDCPQRDERLGWSADTQVFTAAAYRNADVYGFLTKWMTDMRDSASQDDRGRFPGVAPSLCWGACGRGRLGWADAGVIVPWTSWKMTGNKSIVEKNWDAMARFVDFQQKTKYKTAIAADDNYQWADWVSFEKYESASGRGWDSNKRLLPETAVYWDYLAGCYWYWNATRMAEMATSLGRADDVAKYEKMAEEAHGYVKAEFFKDGGRLPMFLRDMQTPHLFALRFGFYSTPEVKEEAVAQLLKNIEDHGGCLQTGFLGTSILMDTLTYDVGRPDVAYSLLLQHKFPSWLYSVDQGATTIWERWNSYTKEKGFGPVGMNSFNHYAYGAVLDWICGTAAGLMPGKEGGFDRSFTLAPIPDRRLGSIEATYRTAKGTIRSAWKYLEDGSVEYTFFVPEGIRADVTIDGKTREWKSGLNKIVAKHGVSEKLSKEREN